MNFIMLLVSDQMWFCTAQLTIVCLSGLALLKISILSEESPVTAVTRGTESRTFISGIASILLTAMMGIVFTISAFPTNGKVLMFLCDVVLISYLCLWNGWSTNKLIGWKNAFEARNFNPHRGA